MNYFNPSFSWYESLFGPPDFQKTLDAFPIVLRGSGANAPFKTLGGLNDTWIQGRRAARYFLNDNLAWSIGAHELRFGTNSRILRPTTTRRRFRPTDRLAEASEHRLRHHSPILVVP